MRPLMLSTVAAFLMATFLLGTSLAGPQSVDTRPRGKAAATSAEPSKSRRYPALAYAVAGLITVIVVTMVAFPSRKETWDQPLEKKPRRPGKRIRGE